MTTFTTNLTTNSLDSVETTLNVGAVNASVSQTYGGALTTNDLTIADNQTSGNLFIGAGTARTSGSINIANGNTSTVQIRIGGANSTTTVGGTLAMTGLIRLGSLDTSIMHRIDETNDNQTGIDTKFILLNHIGQTFFLRIKNWGQLIPDQTNYTRSVLQVDSVGIYTVSYQFVLASTTSALIKTIRSWMSVSSPSQFSVLGARSFEYPSSNLIMAAGQEVWTNGAWTGLINGGSSITPIVYISYMNQGRAYISEGNSYVTITRIA